MAEARWIYLNEDEIEIDGVKIELDGPGKYERLKDDDKAVYMAKSITFIQSYRKLADQRAFDSILEVGLFRGGSTIFLDRFFRPVTLVGVDICDEPIVPLERYIANNRKSNIRTYYRTDQASKPMLSAIIDENFRSGIDLVFDDASHFYEQTKATFEAVFPKLNAGGYYVIEDWGWAHTPGWQVPGNAWESKNSPTNLILELIMIHAKSQEIISRIEFLPGFVYFVRGPKLVDPNSFSVDSHILNRGRALSLF